MVLCAGLAPSPGLCQAWAAVPVAPPLTSMSFQEETRKKPKMSIVASAQPGGEPLCTVDV